MTNWVYGTLYVRGSKENMLNFLNNGISHMHGSNEEPKPHLFILNDDGEIDTHDDDKSYSMWIKGSSRHFMNFDILDSFNYDHENNIVELSCGTEIAWGLEAETFRDISDFGLFVVTFGDEWGMMFAQSFVYENGKMLKGSYRKLTGEDYEEEYPDDKWDWEAEQNEED